MTFGGGHVEGLVQVPALGALHARGAAARARAAGEEVQRVLRPTLETLEAARRDPDPSCMAVVDEDRRASRLEVDVRRKAADVPAVAHRPQGKEGDQRVLGGMQ